MDEMVQINSFLVNHLISYSTADVDERLRRPFLDWAIIASALNRAHQMDPRIHLENKLLADGGFIVVKASVNQTYSN